jgi:hypothetical protein
MPTDLTVYLDDRPGQLAAVGNAMGEAGVNIDGGFGLVVGGQGIMHVLVSDGDAGHRALSDAGFEVRESNDEHVVRLEDRPGALGELARRFADAGVNLTVFYLATHTRAVVGADDMGEARKLV